VKESAVNENMNDGLAKASARRRLIRGAFAAPATFTLCSGGAFAAASNQRCVGNQVMNDRQFPPVGPADMWVRVSVWRHQNGNSAATLLVSGTDVFNLQGTAGNTFIQTGQWKKIVAPFDEFTPNGSRPSRTSDTVALLVNSDGVIVGISTGTAFNDRSAVAKSCWTSFSGVGFMF
jgi:hypothetical protein